VIAISEQVKEHLVKDFKVNEEKIDVIHNGVDLEKFTPTGGHDSQPKKGPFGLSNGPVIGIIARLSDVKGHSYLIEAMKSVLDKVPQAQLFIVGEGKMKKELMDLTRRLGIEKNVVFYAQACDTKEALSAMDLFVLPSLKEGLGLALMEAMAQGLAVIGSDVGGIKTLVQNRHNGLLVPPADINALSGAIIELLADADKRQALGRQANNFIRQNFSQEKMVAQTERVYLKCLSAKS
jgi:glycosyltransferase involved in cell wall biosynthesis